MSWSVLPRCRKNTGLIRNSSSNPPRKAIGAWKITYGPSDNVDSAWHTCHTSSQARNSTSPTYNSGINTRNAATAAMTHP